MSARNWFWLVLAALVVGGIYLSLDSTPPAPLSGLETETRMRPPNPPSDDRSRADEALKTPRFSAQPPAREEAVEPSADDPMREARTPMRLYRDARVQPVYDLATNRVKGVRIVDIEPESFWAQVGVRNEDVILEFNGTLIDTPASTVALMNAVSEGHALSLRLRSPDGEERFEEYRAPR
ncbi:MAG: hypothetical protein VX252_09025 [Myxococcota bacterium]|nr:hypothetical protein [Myxococcota bacterium]